MGLGSNHQGSLDLRLGGTLACHSRVKQSGPVDGAALEHLQAGGCARAILLLNRGTRIVGTRTDKDGTSKAGEAAGRFWGVLCRARNLLGCHYLNSICGLGLRRHGDHGHRGASVHDLLRLQHKE